MEDYSSGIPGDYETPALAGTWSVTDEILEETSSNTGRILRAKPADLETFTFTFRSPHGPADTSDYDPERYALGIVRLDKPDGSDGYRYAAVVIEPTGLFLREWKDDALVGELDSAEVESDAGTWLRHRDDVFRRAPCVWAL